MSDERRERAIWLRSLNGTAAAAPILLALLDARDGLTAADLELVTGYEKRAVSRALALLEALGMVGVGAVAPRGDSWAMPAAARERLCGLGERAPDDAHAARACSSSSSVDDPSFGYGEKKKKDAPGAMAGLLRRAGIGARSPKMAELLALGLDMDYVRRHVEAREEALERGEVYPVGWLINKLACGDSAPAVRRERGYIPAEYQDVVMR